jgi:hypothetical protein
MKEKLWPLIASMPHAKKRSTQKLIEDISKKIYQNFVMEPIIQYTNQISMKAAADLWRLLEPSEMKTREEWNRVDIQSYNNLMKTLTSLLENDTL